MTALPYWHVDAFADQPFRGNQAAVVICERWPDDTTMLAMAEENMFAETAFLVRDMTGAADWQLRWFTPAVEVAMCGHATLASGHVVLGRDGGESVTFRTRKSGILEVRRMEEGYELSLPVSQVEPADNPQLLSVLDAKGQCFVTTGGAAEDTAIVLMESEKAVRALAPDFRRLAEIPLMVICTAPGEKTDIASRVFVSAYGIDEDSVTGSAHAVLAPFWAERLGRNEFTAVQASRRSGFLSLRLEEDRVWLGGQCATVVAGTFYLPG